MVTSGESFGSTFAVVTRSNSRLFIVRDVSYSPAPELSERPDHFFFTTSDESLRDAAVR